ncbi:transposase [Lactobacillus delbrueckii subsp. bulgaricus]|nr:transposase [Lactobacillus delbrueckii]MCD5450430.1 transposase [Lactobacillus delbrueckii subsp. bulgaricus]MCD5455596.1 transposase [Lactobacillus delbrueckii subsp. bulgaricus]MCD5476333.1 transposase [Lactobacillus delbrueckii subsp. bulgaricus]
MQDDAMHKYTTHLVREYDAICIEDLDVKGMLI